MNNIVSNELELASKGLNTLIEQGISGKEKEIFDILNAFPTLKEATLADKEFQTQFFQSLKAKHIKYKIESDYDKHNVSHDWIIAYAQKYDFLLEQIQADEEIQSILQGKIRFEIEWLARVAQQYPDSECIQYNNRLSSLYTLEAIYAHIGVLTPTTREHNSNLLTALSAWTKRRTGSKRYPNVLALIKKAGIHETDISDAIYRGRSENEYNPQTLEIAEFPKAVLEKPDVQGKIERVFRYNIQELDIKKMKQYSDAYSFLHDVCVSYNAAIDKKLANENSTLTEPEQSALHTIKYAILKSIEQASPTKTHDIMGFFPNAKKILTNGAIVNAVYKGIDAIERRNLNTYDKRVTDTATFLQHFPLSHQEIAQYIQQHLEYQIKNCGTVSSYYVAELRKLLSMFPGVDTSKVFQVELIRKSIANRLPDLDKKEDRDYIIQLLGVSETEIEDLYVNDFIARLKDAIRPDNHHNRSYEIKKALKTLADNDIDKVSLRAKLETDEIKGLLHSFAQMKMSDRGWSFTDAFGSDKEIEQLCENPLFPLSAEELHADEIALFLKYCSWGYYDGLDGVLRSYKVVEEKFASEDKEIIEECIKGMVHLLNTKMKSKYNIDSTRTSISLFLRQVPFLRASWNDDRIQQAIQEQANHFLGEGEAEASMKVKSWKELAGIDAR